MSVPAAVRTSTQALLRHSAGTPPHFEMDPACSQNITRIARSSGADAMAQRKNIRRVDLAWTLIRLLSRGRPEDACVEGRRRWTLARGRGVRNTAPQRRGARVRQRRASRGGSVGSPAEDAKRTARPLIGAQRLAVPQKQVPAGGLNSGPARPRRRWRRARAERLFAPRPRGGFMVSRRRESMSAAQKSPTRAGPNEAMRVLPRGCPRPSTGP